MEVRTDPLTGLQALVDAEAPPGAEALPDLFGVRADGAVREQLGETALGDLDAPGLVAAMTGWRERIAAHTGRGAACVQVTAGDGRGATLHALDFVPAAIARERERFGAYAARTMGGNLLGDLVQEEVRRRERVVAYDDEAVLLTAFAARAAYQLLVVPRRPVPRFEADGPLGAGMLHTALRRLSQVLGDGPAPKLWLRTAPQGASAFCWRLDVLPRPSAGAFELATGVPVGALAPERAAAELREA